MTKKPKEALILAGGLGTRLRSVVVGVPKPMADVLDKPFLAYLIEYWVEQGISRFVLSIGYLGDCITNYFGSEYAGAKIEYVLEENPLGTGGAVKQALEQVAWQGDDILLLNGDTWFEADLLSLSSMASEHNLPITMILKTIENNDRYGGVLVDEQNIIVNFTSSNGGKTLINTGCYILNVMQLKNLLKNLPEKFSFEEDMLKPFSAKKMLAASIQEKKFLDIGIPDDYAFASQLLFKKKI